MRELRGWLGSQPPWWLLPRKEYDRCRWTTWNELAWWQQVGWEVLGRVFRLGMRLGVWELDPSCYYTRGHWRWRVWAVRASWPWWAAMWLRLVWNPAG